MDQDKRESAPMESPQPIQAAVFAGLRAPADVPLVHPVIWSVGSLETLKRPTVAVVGTRAATSYGRGAARAFARDLAAAGCTVISGLALGIDAAAHEGALEGGGATIGVIGGGHRCFFPRRNLSLAQKMIDAGGAVLSPFEPDEPAYPPRFLERNGVVAALSDAVVVIEAPTRSGALNTAGWAAGRIPVFAVPGDIDRAHVAGCHALIRDGAILARSAADILEALRVPPLPLQAPSNAIASTPLQAQIIGLLDEERSLDVLIERCAKPPAEVLTALTMLEFSGAVVRAEGNRYKLRR